MKLQTGFILIFDESKRSWRIRDFISSSSPFTEALSSVDLNPKTRDVYLFSLDGEHFDTICLGERKKRVVTLKCSVRFSEFIPIDPPLSIIEIQKQIDKSIQHHFIRVSNGDAARVPTKTWENLIKFIKKKRPEISEKIDRLFKLQVRNEYKGNDYQIESFKRDATTVALKIAGIDSQKATFSFSGPSGEKSAELPPFLTGLENNQLREDRMINHDSKMFSNWNSVNVPPSITAQFTDGSKVLTIQNFNREPVENVLGVDLMYYNHFYKSFVLIQYKAFNVENGKKIYRLNDLTYKSEHEKMSSLQNFLNSIKRSDEQMENYRFHNGVCYFKLCDREVLDLSSMEMIKGMYIPLDYWNHLIKDDVTKGKKEGRHISYDNVGRYFNNTQFIDLVREGWIGSTITQSDVLEKIINEILESKRSVILADFMDAGKNSKDTF